MASSFSIRTKIFLLVGGLLGGIALVSAMGLRGASRNSDAISALHDKGFEVADRTLGLHKHLYKLRGDAYKLLLMPDEQEKVAGDIAKDFIRIDSTLRELDSIGAILPDSLRKSIDSTREATKGYRSTVEAIRDAAIKDDVKFGIESMKSGDAHKARKKLDAHAERLLNQVESFVATLDDTATESNRGLFTGLLVLGLILAALGIAGSIILVRQILSPIDHIADQMHRLGQGDFREEESWDPGGEIGIMVQGMGSARLALRQSLGQITRAAEQVASSSTDQSQLSAKLRAEAETNEKVVLTAATATEEASVTLQTIAKDAADSMGNLESVSAAVEEMSASVSEISRSADLTRSMTGRSLEGARAANERMESLSAASREIESVIEMIVEISEQTKLLALNATIEAARAGEAGKGFAVVAGEVKELAKGTAEATEDIRGRVEAIRSTTLEAVKQIASVVGSMEELGRNIATIASAVEEQSATTQEISRSIGHAVAGNRGVQRNLQEGSDAITGISRDIQSLVRQGKSLRDLAQSSEAQSRSSEQVSLQLRTETGKFRI
ncbi:MAG: methyl-accepting chemotaxis protein [Fibrobacterota bacterium]|nr:methyl-accepting chemotaxis protein [Fibrobacterota bacterium]QQS06448.1 MAG: methyl-accepting chemotaxis protein [Fibrobacterota bacterium]